MSIENQWWKNSLQYSSRTDIGMRRTNNQDSRSSLPAATLRLWRSRGHLFIVADGMGAHAAGERASQIAADSIPQCYLKKTGELPWEAIRNAILETHMQIKRQGQQEEAFHEMGTTVDALVLLPEGSVVAHVGDSRVYRLRRGVYEQLTFDHSLLWEIKRSGRVPPDKIPAYIPKNVITRSLGPTENLVVDVEGPTPIESGDTFLLCSDGLSGQIEDTEMGQLLQLFSPDEATETLINLANLRGGPDNITVTVVKVTDIPSDEELKRDPALVEKRPRIPTPGLCMLAMAIASLVPTFAFLLPKIEHRFAVSFVSLILTLLFSGLFLLLSRNALFPKNPEKRVIEPLGAGPYSQASAIPNSTFADRVTEIKTQLWDAVQNQGFPADQQKIQKWEQVLKTATAEKNYGNMIKYNVRIINSLMAEIKKLSTEKTHDR